MWKKETENSKKVYFRSLITNKVDYQHKAATTLKRYNSTNLFSVIAVGHDGRTKAKVDS